MTDPIEIHTHPVTGVVTETYLDRQVIKDKDGKEIAQVLLETTGEKIHVGDPVKILKGHFMGKHANVVSSTDEGLVLVAFADKEGGNATEVLVPSEDLQFYDTIPPETVGKKGKK